MEQLGNTFSQLGEVLGQLASQLGTILQPWVLPVGLLIAWVAWWLAAVNWKKVWPTLAGGGWAPVVLLMLVSALVWSRISPSETMPNFWGQLGAVCLLALVALFCGWLQGVFGWTPAEIEIEPPAQAVHAAHHHDHA